MSELRSGTPGPFSVPPTPAQPDVGPLMHAKDIDDTEWEPEPTLWVGWIAYAGVMMLMLGLFHAMQGLIALFQEGYYQAGANDLVVHVSYTTWGWFHLVTGLLVLGGGIGLLVGQTWARVVGVVFAMWSAVVNVAFLQAHPVWSTIMIALDIIVIWAIVVHGREVRPRPGPIDR